MQLSDEDRAALIAAVRASYPRVAKIDDWEPPITPNMAIAYRAGAQAMREAIINLLRDYPALAPAIRALPLPGDE